MIEAIIVITLLVLLAVASVYALLLRLRLRDHITDYNVQIVKSARQIAERDDIIQRMKAAAEAQVEAARVEAWQAAQQHIDINRALADAAYDALLVVDDTHRLVLVNDAALALFPQAAEPGQTLEAVTGVPELDMMVSDALINAEAEFEEQILINGRNFRVRAQVTEQSGKQVIGLALRDITQLVRLNRARRDMVANISHELRTPIANIRLIIDGLFHDQDKPKRKDSIQSLRAIAKETDNLLWLVQEMSDLSMIESGQSIVRLIDNPLTDLVEEAIERMEDRAESASVFLVRHVPEKVRVLCDRDLIQRVFVNLIHNAIKWSPKGEPITISAVADEDEVTISVLDNGPGVPPDAVDRIFERFYQVDASRSGGEGTGLGLAICRHIVEAHGGHIWAESNADGAGGRFRFTLLSAGQDAEDSAAEQNGSAAKASEDAPADTEANPIDVPEGDEASASS
ncbi:MAG: sensor histidine kinase [Chloroflexota bacterium]